MLGRPQLAQSCRAAKRFPMAAFDPKQTPTTTKRDPEGHHQIVALLTPVRSLSILPYSSKVAAQSDLWFVPPTHAKLADWRGGDGRTEDGHNSGD